MIRTLIDFVATIPGRYIINTPSAARSVVSIPVYPEFSQEQKNYTLRKIEEFYAT